MPGWVLKGSFFPMNSKNHPQILRKTHIFLLNLRTQGKGQMPQGKESEVRHYENDGLPFYPQDFLVIFA